MAKEEFLNVLYGKEKWEEYKKFQAIEKSINNCDSLFIYFDDIKEALKSEISYVRVRAFKLICKLAKWDKDNKINNIITDLLKELNSDKPTSIRQCLGALLDLMEYKKELINIIKKSVIKIDYTKYKDSMAPLIKKDIDAILFISI